MSPEVAPAADPFARFLIALEQEPALRAELQGVKDDAAFAERCVQLGADRDLAFSAEAVRTLLQQRRAAWLHRHVL